MIHCTDATMIVRESDGEFIVLDTNANLIHQLNGTASLIWRMLKEGATPATVVGEIVRQFDVDEDRASEDVLHTSNLLVSLRLLDDGEGVSADAGGVEQECALTNELHRKGVA